MKTLTSKISIIKEGMSGWAIFGITLCYAGLATLSFVSPLFIPFAVVLFVALIVLS